MTFNGSCWPASFRAADALHASNMEEDATNSTNHASSAVRCVPSSCKAIWKEVPSQGYESPVPQGWGDALAPPPAMTPPGSLQLYTQLPGQIFLTVEDLLAIDTLELAANREADHGDAAQPGGPRGIAVAIMKLVAELPGGVTRLAVIYPRQLLALWVLSGSTQINTKSLILCTKECRRAKNLGVHYSFPWLLHGPSITPMPSSAPAVPPRAAPVPSCAPAVKTLCGSCALCAPTMCLVPSVLCRPMLHSLACSCSRAISSPCELCSRRRVVLRPCACSWDRRAYCAVLRVHLQVPVQLSRVAVVRPVRHTVPLHWSSSRRMHPHRLLFDLMPPARFCARNHNPIRWGHWELWAARWWWWGAWAVRRRRPMSQSSSPPMMTMSWRLVGGPRIFWPAKPPWCLCWRTQQR